MYTDIGGYFMPHGVAIRFYDQIGNGVSAADSD